MGKFVCKECPYRGSSKANLLSHQRKHTDFRPYACRKCPLKFTTSSNLKKHIRCVHEKKKDYKVNFILQFKEIILKYAFFTQCDMCGRCFSTKDEATRHMVSHTGHSQYVCEHCPSVYRYRKALQHHLRKEHSETLPP